MKKSSRAFSLGKPAFSAKARERHRVLVQARRWKPDILEMVLANVTFEELIEGTRRLADEEPEHERRRARIRAALHSAVPSAPPPLPRRPPSVKQCIMRLVPDHPRLEGQSRRAYAQHLAEVAKGQGYALPASGIERELRRHAASMLRRALPH
jgi:hypothetical protein